MAIEFTGTAYSGEVIEDYAFPVVVDLSVLDVPERIPVLFGHDPDEFIGNATPSIEDGRLLVRGSLTETLPRVKDIVSAARDGMPWQLSVGITGDVREATGGEVVNGRAVPAGVYVLSGGRLREVSVVPVGADHRTQMKVAASAGRADILISFDARGANMSDKEAKDVKHGALDAAADAAADAAVGAVSIEAEGTEAVGGMQAQPVPADAVNEASAIIAELRDEVRSLREQVAELKAEALKSKIEAAIAISAGDLPEAVRSLIRAAAKSPDDVAKMADDARTSIAAAGAAQAAPVEVAASASGVSVADMMRKFINKK